MANCYRCGAYISSQEQHYRRTVHTGSSVGSFLFGRRLGGSYRNYYSQRTVCESCARSIDNANTGCLVFGLIAIACVALLLWGPKLSCSGHSRAADGMGPTNRAMVVVSSARIRQGPSTDAAVLSSATEGQSLLILDTVGAWYHVASPESPQTPLGYVHRSLVKVLRP